MSEGLKACQPMPMTLAEKIIARAAGRPAVRPGEIVTCAVDLAMIHDSGGPRRVKPMLERLGVGVWDPARVVVVTDHYVPEEDDQTHAILALTRAWVADQGIGAFYDQQGICHVVLPERGHLRPGMLAVGGDSHSPTGGAFGAYMFGVGATEMAGVLATGEIWLTVPATIRIRLDGALAAGVAAKDVMLHLCARLGLDGGGYQAVEFTGAGVAALPMGGRMTLSNMTAELGGQAGLIAPDATTASWLAAAGVADVDIDIWQGDADAAVAQEVVVDAAGLAPQVALPHSPAASVAVGGIGAEPIDIAYLGACTGAKLDDLRMAAAVLRGARVTAGVRLLVAPASRREQQIATREGTMAVLEAAGAVVLPNACGMCAGYGAARLGEGVRCISSTARNFRGRMGAASALVFLASPYTVAASAVAGRIVDPRPFLRHAA